MPHRTTRSQSEAAALGTTRVATTTGIPGFTLRFGEAKDVPQILRFIRQLARYEKRSREVMANVRTLRRSLFGPRRVAEAILGEHRGKPVAFAVFFHNFSTFLGRPGIYVEDLFVTPAMRGRGVGKAMLAFLAQVAKARGCGRLEWSVLDWNQPAIAFYRKLGAVPMSDWTVFRVTGRALDRLAERRRPRSA